MDSHGSEKEPTQPAKKEFGAGNYRGALVLLLPLWAKQKLFPQQKLDVVTWLSDCCCLLYDEMAALPHTQCGLVFTKQLCNAHSRDHSRALQGLCMVHGGLKAFPEVLKAIREALAVMEDLGLQQDEEYGSMLRELGGLALDQRRVRKRC
jgi:hypothetical protein